jgi:hypothetical protein
LVKALPKAMGNVDDERALLYKSVRFNKGRRRQNLLFERVKARLPGPEGPLRREIILGVFRGGTGDHLFNGLLHSYNGI